MQNVIRRAYSLVIVSPDDDDQIYGWIVFEHHNNHVVIHYVYVKAIFLGLGLGKLLLKSALATRPATVPRFYFTAQGFRKEKAKAMNALYVPQLISEEFYAKRSAEE